MDKRWFRQYLYYNFYNLFDDKKKYSNDIKYILEEFELTCDSVDSKIWSAKSKDQYNYADVESFLDVNDLFYDADKKIVIK